MTKIAVLPGDGIGPEITEAALMVLDKAKEVFGIEIETQKGYLVAVLMRLGTPFPEETWQLVQESTRYFRAVGGPQWDNLPRT